MSEFQDSNVVFVYTREDAIRDGVLIEVDTYKGKQICITDNAYKIAGLEDETLRNHVIKAAIEALSKPDENDASYKKLRSILVKGHLFWAVWTDTEGFTIMLPSDY